MKKIQLQTIETERRIDVPVYRMLEKGDVNSLLKLMEEIKPNIGGSRDLLLYRALCYDALLNPRVVFTVGEVQTRIIAFYFAVIDRNRWRISFMFRHPLIVTKMVIKRALKKLSKLLKTPDSNTGSLEHLNPDISTYATPDITNKSWNDSSPQIAKLLYIAVKENHRGKDIAKEMWEYALKVLAERGVRRVDTEILLKNEPSIRLHYGLGFNIYRQGSALFVTKDLS